MSRADGLLSKARRARDVDAHGIVQRSEWRARKWRAQGV